MLQEIQLLRVAEALAVGPLNSLQVFGASIIHLLTGACPYALRENIWKSLAETRLNAPASRIHTLEYRLAGSTQKLE
jgi:hypothetical protein